MSDRRPRAYLDANVFIAAFETNGARSDHAWWVLDAIERGDIAGATSEITLAEVLVKPIERGAADLVAAYKSVMATGANFEVAPVRRDILVRAAGLRAERSSVKLPDAIHIASAELLGCAIVVSDAMRLRLPSGIKSVPMNPFTLDNILGAAR